jgi:hypothetical protein
MEPRFAAGWAGIEKSEPIAGLGALIALIARPANRLFGTAGSVLRNSPVTIFIADGAAQQHGLKDRSQTALFRNVTGPGICTVKAGDQSG